MQPDGRLPSELWIKAHIKRCIVDGIPATVVHRGEKNSGTLILKINQLEAGCKVLSQARNLDGDLAWMPALGGGLVEESAADAYIDRAVTRDPDVWVVEIEDREGRHPFEGKVL
ncbi:DUF1491 family protein [Pelagibius litoralis]|uniref:DUF1491 family protein n=1 Tax=Pelagibius litoralis TaxID=374515 RepID=A0A967C1V8_9PROT|nr:DUF1491 family protein [Pelagibius litoralis]NIA67148.1 DUF1491 family protein [Pelagibius litoralis]